MIKEILTDEVTSSIGLFIAQVLLTLGNELVSAILPIPDNLHVHVYVYY